MRIIPQKQAPAALEASQFLSYIVGKIEPEQQTVNVNSAKVNALTQAFAKLPKEARDNYATLSDVGKKAVADVLAAKIIDDMGVKKSGWFSLRRNHIRFSRVKARAIPDTLSVPDISKIVSLRKKEEGEKAFNNDIAPLYDGALEGIQRRVNALVDELVGINALGEINVEGFNLNTLKGEPERVSRLTCLFAERDMNTVLELSTVQPQDLAKVEALSQMVQDLSVAKNKLEGAKKLGIHIREGEETAVETFADICGGVFNGLKKRAGTLTDNITKERTYTLNAQASALDAIKTYFITGQDLGINSPPFVVPEPAKDVPVVAPVSTSWQSVSHGSSSRQHHGILAPERTPVSQSAWFRNLTHSWEQRIRAEAEKVKASETHKTV